MIPNISSIQRLTGCAMLTLVIILGCSNTSEKHTDGIAAKVGLKQIVEKPVSKKAVRRMIRDSTNEEFFPSIPMSKYDSIFAYNSEHASDGFDFPVGKPNGERYFKAQEFGDDLHLGEDWNKVTGGNTDLGDPVYAVSNGLVTFSKDVCCGWGNVIRIVHKTNHHSDYPYVESIYAHLHNRFVEPGQMVKRGDKIGTIGTAKGRYSAHLHLEIRDFINMSLGPGYSEDTYGFLVPSDFISSNRPK